MKIILSFFYLTIFVVASTSLVKDKRQTSPECKPNPCLNGATCVTQSNGAFNGCFCTSSYMGTYCEIKKAVCPQQNICGEGVCEVTNHPSFEYQYVCKCSDGVYRFEKCPTNCANNPCLNGGVCTSGGCICGSGYSGNYCETLTTYNLCQNINCKNTGICNVVSSKNAECFCPTGYGGYYCDLLNVGNRCSFVQCMNGGSCEEHKPGVTTYAYCNCKAGFSGSRCENEYFRCTSSGLFNDRYGCDVGRYFECTNSGGATAVTLTRKDCPPGLRFNLALTRCDYSRNVKC